MKKILLTILIVFSVIQVKGSSNQYSIKELNAQVEIPSSYVVLSRDSTDEVIKKYGFSKESFANLFNVYNSYLIAFDPISFLELHISMISGETTKEIDNLKYASDSVVSSLGKGYSMKLGEYKIYNNNQAKYFLFSYDLPDATAGHLFISKYKTIIISPNVC